MQTEIPIISLLFAHLTQIMIFNLYDYLRFVNFT